jgi:hypothetical protein
VNRIRLSLCAVLVATAAALSAQSSSSSLNLVDASATASGGAVRPATLAPKKVAFGGPFSHFAISGGVSFMGASVSTATNLNRYMNLRASGNLFNYTVDNISTNGFNVNAKLNLASAGTSLDFYPFPKHGLRFSPGVLFYNQNRANATFTVASGTSFTLNDYTYYPSSSNPVVGVGSVGLHNQRPAFTATAGWGNMIPRSGKHWAFPFEIGAAFIGAPSLNMALTSGQVCDAQGQNCVNVATDPTVQSNLQAQVAKYKNDLEPLKTYPIISFGVSYSFRVRKAI